MKTNIFWLFWVFGLCGAAYPASARQDACEYFFDALKTVPHEHLSRNNGMHESLWDGKKYLGCEVKLVTNNTLLSGREAPSFEANEGADLFRLGWRTNNSLVADGPGTGIFGIEKGSVLCLISHSQPAYLDEKENIIQSETLTIIVQCRQK